MKFGNFKFTAKEILFFLLLVAIVYRSPYILFHGRFSAEEGSLYFANAYKEGFLYSIFFIDFSSGYFNLWANISGIIANLFSLKLSPLISNYLALIPILLIFHTVIYKSSYLTDNLNNKIILSFIILFSPNNVPEVWLNSINAQIFLCILTFLILCKKNGKNNISFFDLVVILFSALSGIYTCILTPIFFYKLSIYKTIQDKYNFVTILSCTFIQFVFVLYSKFNNILHAKKLHPIDFELIINYVYNIPVKSFLGRELTHFFYNLIDLNSEYIFLLLCVILTIIVIYFFYFFKKNINTYFENKFLLYSLLYAFIATSLLVLVGAAGEYTGGRYAVLPSFYLLSTVYLLSKIMNKSRLRSMLYVFLAISITSGFYDFKNNNKYKEFLICVNCPNWANEVNKFEKDNNYILKIWPYTNNKNMRLN